MFVGRSAQLRAVTAELDAVTDGAARAVHLVGEAGIGKTSLARQVSAQAQARGFRTSWGRSWSGALAPPYWLWSQILDDLRVPLPELSADQGAVARTMLLRAFLTGVRTAAVDRPLLIVLDDLHDADPASLMLTGALLRGLPERALLVLSTQRPGYPALDGMNRHGLMLPVPAFGTDDIAELIAGCPDPPDVDAAGLLEVTGGNPFHVIESLRTGLDLAAGRRLGALLSTLDDDARQVVAAAAVIGPCPPQGLLAAVAGLPPARCTAALAAAAAAGLLDGEHRFRHALLREHCYASVPVPQRAALHVAAADAMDRTGAAPGYPAAFAHHRRAAVPHGDPAAAVDATCTAAVAALHAYAPEDAVAQCTAGLATVAAYGSEATAWRCRLLTLRGEAESMAGDPRTARHTVVEAIGLAAAAGDPVLLAEAVLRLPRRERFLQHDPELTRYLADAIGRLGPADPALRVRLLAKLAYDSSMSDDSGPGQDARQLPMTDQLVAEARALGDPALLAEALSTRLFASWSPETLELRRTLGPEIARLGRKAGDLNRELDGLLWQFMAELENGNVDGAHSTLDEYTFRAERGGRPDHLAFARSRAATLASLRGRYADAERLSDEAREHSRAAGSPDADAVYLTQMVTWAWARGGRTAERFDAYCDTAGASTHPLMAVVRHLYVGRSDDARAPVRGMRAILDRTPGPPRLYAWALLAEAAFLLDERDLAADLYDRMLPFPDRCAVSGGAAAALGAVSQALGLCALTLGNLEAAVRWLRSAVDRNRSFGADPYTAASRADLADALLRADDVGNAGEAAALLAEADAIAGRLGMDRLTDRIAAVRAGLPDGDAADDRALARTVAVLGPDADRGLLAAACDLPAERFLAALARTRQPAQPQPAQPQPAQPQPRTEPDRAEPDRAEPDRAEPDRADRLRAAEAIERLGLRRRYREVLARLRLGALPLGDPAAAVAVTLDATRAALDAFEPATAVELSTLALDAIATFGDPARVWRAELLTALGAAHAAAGDHADATRILDDAVDLADLAGAPAVAVDAVLAMPLDARYEPGSCGPVEAQLRARLATASEPHRVRIMARLGADALAGRPGLTRDREELVDRAVAEARTLVGNGTGDGPLLVGALGAWLRTVLGPDRIAERLAVGAETVDLARRHGVVAGELAARLGLFTALLTIGRVEQAEAELTAYERLAARIGAPRYLMYARSRRATLAALRGEYDAAGQLSRAAFDAGRAVTPDAAMLLDLQSFTCSWIRGELDREVCSESVRRTALVYPLVVALILHRDGRPDEAREQLRASIGMLDVVPAGFELFGLVLVADLAHRLGDAGCAAEVARRLAPYPDHVAVAGTGSACAGSVARAIGLCAATTGDLDSAVAMLGAGIVADGRLGARPLVAAGTRDLAAVTARRDGTAPPGTAPRTAPPSADRIGLVRQGEQWSLTYRERTTVLRHSKGLAQLAVLLANPGREIPAVELAGGVDSADRMPVLDEAAKLSYRNRLTALESRLAHGDDAAVAVARDEYDAIVRTLKAATGLRGRTRHVSDEAERARINVTRTLRQAIDQILAVDEAAGLHLHAAVRTGARCCYVPPA